MRRILNSKSDSHGKIGDIPCRLLHNESWSWWHPYNDITIELIRKNTLYLMIKVSHRRKPYYRKIKHLPITAIESITSSK